MPSTLDISLFTGKLQYYFKRSFLFIVIVQSSVSEHPRHLCTSFWTTTNMASNCTLHAQVLCVMTVHPTKNTVYNTDVQIAAYVQLVPVCIVMKAAVYSVLQVMGRNNYFIVDIHIVKDKSQGIT